ncbi:ABC transporter ATP-binding protein [Lacticigenium naphthae]|uniref:ABC transporter ATP-binding protein n=1 Tax=Lacticigenium naphthae TaxID=515351 RepID=UPI000416B3C7|nr:ABC transporter ATP-binding protein [Lacticigenium naphthae]
MIRLSKLMNQWHVAITVIFMATQVAGMLAMPTLTANIIDYGVAQGDIDYIARTGLIMLAISFMTIGSAFINVRFAAIESQGLGNKIRKKIFALISHLTNEEMDKFGTATLITRSTNDVMQIQFVMMLVLRMMLLAPFLMIGAAYMAFSREPQLAFVFLISMPLLAIILGVILKFASPIFKSMQKKTDRLNLIFREGLTGIRVIRAFNKSGYEENRFDEANTDYSDTAIRAFTIMGLVMPSMTFAISITNVMIIWFGSQLISTGDMQVGNMVAFLTYAMQILIGIMNLSMVLFFVPRGQVSAQRINEVLDTPNEIKDPENPKPLETEKNISLEFENVGLQYTGAEEEAISGIDFKVNKGETVAIIGGTGSGKTTLANLIPRLFEVTSGAVKVNGTNVKELKQKELRDLIGFAPQKALLFKGTIRENMQYGNPDATDEVIWHALEIAQGKEFVSGLPKKLDAPVEQSGGNFSGGQRQRLSIARALLTFADIYVFDDSFSALDFKTDAKLREALKPETKDSIVIIIAQRISTVVDADLILVLDNGKMVGKGTHDELKESSEIYKEIMESQLKGEDI